MQLQKHHIKTFEIVLPPATLLGLWGLLCHWNNKRRITTRAAPPTTPPIMTHFLLELPPSRQQGTWPKFQLYIVLQIEMKSTCLCSTYTNEVNKFYIYTHCYAWTNINNKEDLNKSSYFIRHSKRKVYYILKTKV